MNPWASHQNDSYHIPRWLFRTWSPGSNGVNSASLFTSSAAANGKKRDTYDQATSQTKAWLAEAHVRWWNKPDDMLISFSSSIIFAIQHGIFKIARPRDPLDNSEQAHLTIIDTKGIEVAFKPMLRLLQDSNLNEKRAPALWHGWYEHEYVAQNFLVHKSHSVTFSFQQLADAGLFRVYDEFRDETKFCDLCTRWQELSFGMWQDTPWRMNAAEQSMIQRLTRDVEPHRKYMVALNLLSMKARSIHDHGLHNFLGELQTAADDQDDDRGEANPDLVLSREMKVAYRTTEILRALKSGTNGLAMLTSIMDGDLFMTVEEGLSFLVQASGAGFEPIQTPDDQEARSTGVSSSLQTSQNLLTTGSRPGLAPCVPEKQKLPPTGLVTPPPSRRTSAN